MTPTDPQFMYMILVLPGLFGLILLGDGINRIVHEEWSGVISIVIGLVVLGASIFVYPLLSSHLAQRGGGV